MMQSIIVAAFWVVGVFAYLIIFTLFVTRCEKCNKPVRADVRITPLSLTNKDSIELFSSPEEDIIYAGMRKSS